MEARRLHARTYWKFAPSLTSRPTPALIEDPLPTVRGKVHVGFHSAFFFRHSVGLLMEGVIVNVDREKVSVSE